MLSRYNDWPTRLHDYLMDAHTRTFEYGVFDCVHHTADAVFSMTGEDIIHNVRGYNSLLTAKKQLKRFGGTVELATAQIAREFQMPEIKPLFAHRGDVVVMNLDGESMSGIIDLNGRITAPTQNGFVVIELNRAIRAWRV